jgi:hypothetical protein
VADDSGYEVHLIHGVQVGAAADQELGGAELVHGGRDHQRGVSVLKYKEFSDKSMLELVIE